jgi:hypothetical protein
LLVAEAENWTGDVTVAPLAGELTFTCAEQKTAPKRIINAIIENFMWFEWLPI